MLILSNSFDLFHPSLPATGSYISTIQWFLHFYHQLVLIFLPSTGSYISTIHRFLYPLVPISLLSTCSYISCSGQKTPDNSWGRLSEARGDWGSGNLKGGGFGERVGTGEVSLQATWDRGGRILSQLGGFQVSRRGLKGKKGEQGETKGNLQGECVMYIVTCIRIYKRMRETFEWYVHNNNNNQGECCW